MEWLFAGWIRNKKCLPDHNARRIGELVGVDDVLLLRAGLLRDDGERIALLHGVIHAFLRVILCEGRRRRRDGGACRLRLGERIERGVGLVRELLHLRRDLQALHPDAKLYFITGADALGSILTWQGWEELFTLATFIGVSRPGYELTDSHITDAFERLPDDALHLVEVPALAISSTDCRRRASAGRPIWYLVPDGVVQYVAKSNLYRTIETQGAPL